MHQCMHISFGQVLQGQVLSTSNHHNLPVDIAFFAFENQDWTYWKFTWMYIIFMILVKSINPSSEVLSFYQKTFMIKRIFLLLCILLFYLAQMWKYVIWANNFYRSHICSVSLKITQKNMLFNSWNPYLYDYAIKNYVCTPRHYNVQWTWQNWITFF
jgi:hypothetical protein